MARADGGAGSNRLETQYQLRAAASQADDLLATLAAAERATGDDPHLKDAIRIAASDIHSAARRIGRIRKYVGADL